jgi:DNA-binding CsgD family transcriptional regulator
VIGSEADRIDTPRWDTLDAALATLRLCRAVAELTERAGELALSGCRAEAAAIGRVTDGVWIPWLRTGETSLLETDEMVPAAPVQVDDAPTLEQQVIRFGRTGVRHLSTSSTSAGGRQIVVAAVASAGTVLGMLHIIGRDLEVEIVETYANALGSVWRLIGARQRADEQRFVLARLRSALGESADRPIELVDAGLDLRGGLTAAVSPPSNSNALRSSLTVRQREVLDLMMAGASNAEIAERLVVALPTVKSHVRAILRASGAVNRSDAVARFARVGGSPPSPSAR